MKKEVNSKNTLETEKGQLERVKVELEAAFLSFGKKKNHKSGNKPVMHKPRSFKQDND